MITYNDQMDFFGIISDNLDDDIECWAFGGTAMMFYGYKDDTKDIDLLFENGASRKFFIDAIEKLGFEETSPIKIYIPEKLRGKGKPLMFKRDEFRLDLFEKEIFRTKLSPRMKEDKFAVHEFRGKNNLKVNVLRKEHIVQLKAITERDRDFEDILTILRKDKNFDWQYLIDETIWQHRHGDSWALLDMEKMMKGLKKYVLIPEKYFRQIYDGKKHSN